MGSTLTVMLSFTRNLNIALLSTLLVNKYGSIKLQPSILIGVVFFLIILIGMKVHFKYNPLNYFSTPLPELLEMSLPIIMLYLLYSSYKQKTGNPDYGLVVICLIYLYGLYRAIFPKGEGVDKIAADNFKRKNGLIK